jgi:DNA-binding MarR family transcriptional regulator
VDTQQTSPEQCLKESFVEVRTPRERASLDAFAAFMLAQSRLTNEIEASLLRSKTVPLDVYDVLVTLESAPDQRLTFSDLADKVVLSRSGLTRRIDRLVALGYVERQACPEDRRRGYAALTEAGRLAREAAWPTLRDAIHRWFGSRMSEGEARQLAAVMRRIVSGLENDATRSAGTP